MRKTLTWLFHNDKFQTTCSMSQLRFLNMGISFKSDIDDCSNPNTCQNGGTCHDLVNDYMCICVPGYTDKNCSTGNMAVVQHFSLHHHLFSMAQQYKRKKQQQFIAPTLSFLPVFLYSYSTHYIRYYHYFYSYIFIIEPSFNHAATNPNVVPSYKIRICVCVHQYSAI